MSQKDGFIDSLKHMVFEDEPGTAKPAQMPHAAAPQAPEIHSVMSSAAVQSFAQPSFADDNVGDNNEVYQRLLAKTDFTSTEIGATVQKFLAPLENLPMDAALKFKTAVAQAKAQNGLNEADILSIFDELRSALRQEQEGFNTKAKQFAAREITGRQDRITQITSQITQLQQDLAQLTTQVVEAQAKAARAQGQFAAAIERRTSEIEQQKAQYSALLK
jgi:septal ring factor EnvC (AmiA/AmiB activator)